MSVPKWCRLATPLLLVALSSFAAEPDLRLEHVRESLTGTHYTYRQYIDGVPVIGGERVESRDWFGIIRSSEERLAVDPKTENRNPNADAVINLAGIPRFARRVIVEERKLEPWAHYLDAETGELLRREPLFWNARARVFTANPVTKLNEPALRDRNDAAFAVPDSAYTEVDIETLPTTAPPRGLYLTIVDAEAPTRRSAASSGPLMFDRGQPEFEEVNAYFHIDRVQRYLQSLGYSGARQLVNYAIEVDAHAANGTDNSYYVSANPVAGRGALYFGDGGTDDAEDPDIVIHEYGHAIQDWIAPGSFTGLSSSQSRAMAEGFCDYWAFSFGYEESIATGRDPYCIADWDARCAGDDPNERCGYVTGADCLRRVDSTKTMRDFIVSDTGGTEHRNGEIWSSALREIFLITVGRYGLARGRQIMDTIAVESHFGTPPNPTFRAMARKLLDADRLLYGGADTSAICRVMTMREILAEGDCDRMPRGEVTYFPAPSTGVAIPDNTPNGITSRLFVADARTIERVYVQVNIDHSARGDLQLVLIAPDGTPAVLYSPTLDRTQDISATFGYDSPTVQSLDVFRGKRALGQWQLLVTDRRPRDSGSLLSWSLAFEFTGDEPLTARPTTTRERRHIAAVSHTPGANGTFFISDVRVFNRSSREARVTLLFTPSGADGTTRFAAVRVAIAARQVVALDDIVRTIFQTVGTGQVEIVGDVEDLTISSRNYTRRPGGGTYGQFIPAVATTAAAGAPALPLLLAQLQSDAEYRSNIGFAEVAGAPGVVSVRVLDAQTGEELSTTSHAISAFGHAQFPVGGAATMIAEVHVVEGDARVIAYGSVVDNRSGDPIYITARRAPVSARAEVAPVISGDGANQTRWRSDVWLTTVDPADAGKPIDVTYVDAPTQIRTTIVTTAPPLHRSLNAADVVRLFASNGSIGTLRINVPAGVIATSRTWTGDVSGGTYGQYIPFVPELEAAGIGAPAQQLLHIESSDAYRTNLGLYEASGNPAVARVAVFDGAGTELARTDVPVMPLQLVQLPLTAIVSRPLFDARVTVDVVGGTGRVVAYASIVDNVTGDPTYVGPAQ